MPITPFLSGRVFDPETTKTLSDVFRQALERLRLTDHHDAATAAVAEKIIELAQSGVRDPEVLFERTLRAFDIPE
jgi:hypothetical protein